MFRRTQERVGQCPTCGVMRTLSHCVRARWNARQQLTDGDRRCPWMWCGRCEIYFRAETGTWGMPQ